LDAAQVIAKMTNIKNRYENDPDAVANIIAEAVRHIKSVGLLQSEIHAIIRNALTVAASDGLIEQCELETIYEFASRLDISKPEIHILMVQLGYLQKN
jgi:tellurite resistance protein